MNPNCHRLSRSCTVATALLVLFSVNAGALEPNEWRQQQTLDVPAAGLVRIDLPPATLGAARPALEDLRVIDSAGNEVPFFLEQPAPQPELRQRAKSFQLSLEASATKLLIETGVTAPIGGVTLETPARDFIKAARAEGSHDGQTWEELAAGQPLFRLPDGATKLRVEFPSGVWEWLRLTIDDRRAEAVPFTAAQVHGEKAKAPSAPLAVTIKSRDESPGVTRLALDLGAANLRLAAIELETPEPLFTRAVTVAVPEVSDAGIREQPIAEGAVHRVASEGTTTAQLAIEIEKQVRSRELLVLIRNQDSPPLAIQSVRAERRLTRVVFLAREPGQFRLLTGNSQCSAPRYDVAALADRLKNATAAEIALSGLAENPGFRAPETLPGLTETSAPLDISAWKLRKPIQLTQPGVQQIDLDLDVLSQAAPSFADLRVMREDRQLPFLLERTSISRAITPAVAPANDPQKPRQSRWSLKLPKPGLPLTRLAVTSATPLFAREMRLWEEATDDRGNKFPRELGRADWRRTPSRSAGDLMLEFSQTPVTDTLLLETDNGDNSPIDLANFRAYHGVTRVVFKTASDPAQPLRLYYGNRQAAAPRYDLSLVAAPLLAAEKNVAALGAEEGGKKASWLADETVSASRRIVFWGVLALVVAGLLFVLARLLPKAAPPDA